MVTQNFPQSHDPQPYLENSNHENVEIFTHIFTSTSPDAAPSLGTIAVFTLAAPHRPPLARRVANAAVLQLDRPAALEGLHLDTPEMTGQKKRYSAPNSWSNMASLKSRGTSATGVSPWKAFHASFGFVYTCPPPHVLDGGPA